MLLYHFPLNTQENIENFTNKGIKDDIEFANSEQMVVATEGCISQTSLYNTKYTNGWYRFKCNGLNHQKGSLCFRLKLDNSYLVNWSTCCQFFGEENDGGMFRYYTSSVNRLQDGGLKITENSFDGWKNFVFNYEVINNVLIGKWYVDGVLTLTRDNYANTYIESISFGGRWTYNATQNLKYYIQDIRIYDYALSQAEINEYSKALIVHYPMNGNMLNGNVLKDVSGFGNDATRRNGVYVEDSPRAEISLYKSGTPQEDRNGCVRTAISTPSKYSISLWFKYDFDLTRNSTFSLFHASKSWGSVGSMFYIQTNKSLVWGCYNENNIWETLNVANVSKNIWHHIVLSYDGETKNLYYEGNLVQSKNSPIIDNYLDVAKLLTFGGFSISDYRVYATALSAEDIKNLYNSPIAVSKQHQTMAFEFVEGNDGFSAKKNGIVQHNELRENDSDVNGCYNDKLITNELIEN